MAIATETRDNLKRKREKRKPTLNASLLCSFGDTHPLLTHNNNNVTLSLCLFIYIYIYNLSYFPLVRHVSKCSLFNDRNSMEIVHYYYFSAKTFYICVLHLPAWYKFSD